MSWKSSWWGSKYTAKQATQGQAINHTNWHFKQKKRTRIKWKCVRMINIVKHRNRTNLGLSECKRVMMKCQMVMNKNPFFNSCLFFTNKYCYLLKNIFFTLINKYFILTEWHSSAWVHIYIWHKGWKTFIQLSLKKHGAAKNTDYIWIKILHWKKHN